MKAKTDPVTSPRDDPTAMKATLTPFSMISTLMRMTRAFLRATTPAAPIPKRMPDRSRYADGSIISISPRGAPSDPLFRQGDRPDHRGQEEHRGHLEGQEVIAEQGAPDRLDRAGVDAAGRGRPEPPGDEGRLDDEEPGDDDAQEPQARRALDRQLPVGNDDQHDDEDEQEDEGPGVDDDLDRREEMGVPQDEQGRHGEQGQDEVEL